MKKFKLFDVWLSIILFISLAVWFGINPSLNNLVIAYFIIGGWQATSMTIHEWNKWFVASKGTRRVYHWISLISLATMPMGFAWVLAMAAPFMALYYIGLCYKEVYVKMNRPLALLK